MEQATKVNVLGTEYGIRRINHGEDKYMDENNFAGYCDSVTKEIIILSLRSMPEYKNDPDNRIEEQEKETLRHEIVHAFLNESGLQESSFRYEGGWAHNEEMVDWIARQGKKIYKAWQEGGAI